MTRIKQPTVDEEPFDLLDPDCMACGERLALSDIDWSLIHIKIRVHNRGDCLAFGNVKRDIFNAIVQRALYGDE
jgi:hypothetical protein